MAETDDAKTFSMTVTSKGQVTLPAKFRALVGIEAGDKLDLVVGPDGAGAIRRRSGRLADLRGAVPWTKGPIDDDALEAMVARARKRRGGR